MLMVGFVAGALVWHTSPVRTLISIMRWDGVEGMLRNQIFEKRIAFFGKEVQKNTNNSKYKKVTARKSPPEVCTLTSPS